MAQSALALALAEGYAKAGQPLPIDQARALALEVWDQRPGSNGGQARVRHMLSSLAELPGAVTLAILRDWHESFPEEMIVSWLSKTDPAPPKRRPTLVPPQLPAAASYVVAERITAERNEIRRHRSGTAVSKAIVKQLSRLDTFKVNGMSIGNCTPEDANAWADSQQRDVRFVRLLTHGLPPGRPIRESLRGEEADTLYIQVEQERRGLLSAPEGLLIEG